MSTISALILAAGASLRMGQSKQMLDIHGEKLLTRCIRAVVQSGINDITVVLGANEDTHRALLRDMPVDIVRNPDWAKGMGSSIKAGMKYLLEKTPLPDGVILLVCDQPLLNNDLITNLVMHYQATGKPVIASQYANTAGVPVLFGKSYFSKLTSLPDDQGAKKLILQNPADVALVLFPGGEVDLDTMEDYEAFVKGRRQS